MRALFPFVIFFLSGNVLAECELSNEYKEARKEVARIVYGSDNSYSKCKDSGKKYDYWVALAKCEKNGDGKDIGGGCAHLVGHSVTENPIDISHCEIFKFDPSSELASKLLAETVDGRNIKKCKN